jgi:hypothetical protein
MHQIAVLECSQSFTELGVFWGSPDVGVFRNRVPQAASKCGTKCGTAMARLSERDSKGRSPCENSSAFSHGPILFAFSSPQTAWNRKNRENFRSA